MKKHPLAYYLGYYAARIMRPTTLRFILIGMLVLLVVYAIWSGAEERQRKALENNPVTTAACYEDSYRPCHIHEMDTTP